MKFATENTDDEQSSKNIITFILSCHIMSNDTVSELTVFEDIEGHKHVPVSIFFFVSNNNLERKSGFNVIRNASISHIFSVCTIGTILDS